MDAIVIPVGGGGLIAGVALAVKTMKPDVLIIGVEPEVTSRHQGHSSGSQVIHFRRAPASKLRWRLAEQCRCPPSPASQTVTQYTPMQTCKIDNVQA